GLEVAPGNDARRILPARQRRGRACMELVAVAGQHQPPARMRVPGEGDDAHQAGLSACRLRTAAIQRAATAGEVMHTASSVTVVTARSSSWMSASCWRATCGSSKNT